MGSSRRSEGGCTRRTLPLRRAAVFLCFLTGVALQTARASDFVYGEETLPAAIVGQRSAAVTIVLTAQTSGSAGAPTILTEGVSSPDLQEFIVADLGTCGAEPSLAAGQSCTVQVVFSPRYPGVRHGAVSLKSTAGQLLATTLLSGVGQGSLPVLIPGQISTVAGNGQWFYQGDGGQATAAPIYLPSGLAVDGGGNLFFADTINNRIRRVDAGDHTISTVAGNGSPGNAGDGGPAITAQISNPSAIALDGAGDLFIADTGNHAIRRVDAVSKIITTVAGTLGASGYFGDGGPGINAKLNSPQGLALTPAGDLVIADTLNSVIRLLTAKDAQIQTIAGTGVQGYNGEGLLAVNAQFNEPTGVAVRADGAIAIADLNNNRVRLMTIGGTALTVAGNGALGYSGDGGAATQAALQGPAAIAFDPAGDLIIADSVNNCVRLVYGNQGTIVTLVGTPGDDRFYGDGGPEDQARLHGPDGLFFDPMGNLWVADRFNNRVREVSGSQLTIGPYPTMKVGKISQPVAEQMMNAGNQPLVLSAPVLDQAALDGKSTRCGQSALASSNFCKMGVEFAPTNVGPVVNGVITWASNAQNVTPIDALYGEVLNVEPTSTALTANVNPALLGQAVVLTASITSDDKGRTGTVDFIEGATTLCHVNLSSNGAAACQVSGLALGTHNFVANYSGDNNNAGSTSPIYQVVVKQQAALALSVSPNPAVVTKDVLLSLIARDSTGTPTGTIDLLDGTTVLTTLTLDSNGQASWSASTFGIGQHLLSAKYSGDQTNMAGVSNSVSFEVDQSSTSTALTSSTDNAPVGTSLSLSASVVSAIDQSFTGSIQLLEGAEVLATATIGGDGTASFSLASLTPGTHSLRAVYSGDTDHATSTSATITQHVQQIATVTTLGADVDPLAAGATVQLSAIVQMAPSLMADGPLTGSVTFLDAGTVLGTATLNAAGQATFSTKSLSVGVHHITARFEGNANYAVSQSTQLNEIVQQTQSTIALSAGTTNTLKGKPVSFQAAVTSATGIPTGTVTFRDGSDVLTTVPIDSAGRASFITTQLDPGNHVITATYNGDANYLASASGALQVSVSLAQPALALLGPGSIGVAGVPAQFSTALTSDGVQPTGNVSLLDGATIVATQPVSGNGIYHFSSASFTVGAHQLSARYSGDGNNAPVSSSALTYTVQQAATVVSLLTSVNPLTQGQSLTLTAGVTSSSPDLTGQVAFFDGSTSLGSVALTADGHAALITNALALGAHTLTAVYSGDVPHAGSSSEAVPELVVQALGLAVSSSENPSVSGHTVIFTGRLSGFPLPTGTLTFHDGVNLLASSAVDGSGSATFGTSALSVGTHHIIVSYGGDTHFAKTSADVTQTVLQATTATTLTVDANPGVYGSALTFTAVVTSNGATATGDVSLMEAGVVLGSAKLDRTGRAIFAPSNLSPGAHTIVAQYLSDGNASASVSTPLAVGVKQSTGLALTSDRSPTLTLTPVTLTAKVTNAGAAPVTGTVTFTEGEAILGSAPVTGDTAVLQLTQMTVGTHGIVSSYMGDGKNFSSQSSAFHQVVQLRPTSTSVTGAATDENNPQQITLISVVHGDGSVPPSGLVTFTNGAITLGAAQIDSTGVATITVIFENPSQQIIAAYDGDASYSGSRSGATQITAGKPAQFTLAVSSADLTLVSHQKTTMTVTVASVKGFTDNISLGCLGLPYAATCTFDKTKLKLNPDGTESASLIVDTGDPLGAGSSRASHKQSPSQIMLCFAPLGFFLAILHVPGRRKRLPTLLALGCIMVISAMGLAGCAGLQMSGTPVGSYSFQVIATGQGSNITEVQTVKLVVTQ